MFVKNRKIFTIIASLIMASILMFSMASCKDADKSGNAGTPTIAPGDDYVMEISGPTELTVGETVKYSVKVTECDVKDGLLGLDFSIEYNNELLEYVETETVKVPAPTWEIISRDDSDSMRTYASFDDNNDMDNLVCITDGGQYEVALVFKVVGDSSENKNLITMFDITGAKNDEDISTVYGKANSITLG